LSPWNIIKIKSLPKINTASIEFRGVQPDVRELRLVPIPNLGLS